MPNAPRPYRPPGWQPAGKSHAAAERSKHYRTAGWRRIRQRILARDGMQCQICGKLCIGEKEAHVDHIRPVAEGGSDDPANLRCLCASCHSTRTIKDQHK